MKKLTLLTTLTISLMFSPVCWGEWVYVTKSVSGKTFYLDPDRIRQHEGYVYFWDMLDYPIPTKYGDMSVSVYHQGDCEMFRYKDLSGIFYKESMGSGDPFQSNPPDTSWKYPPPDSADERILKTVCDSVKTK